MATNYATFSSGPSGGASKKQLSIHKIRDLQLDTVNIEENYDVLKEIGSGDYGKVILAAHKLSGFEVRFNLILLHFKIVHR